MTGTKIFATILIAGLLFVFATSQQGLAQVMRMEGFGFGARIPVQTAQTVASTGNAGFPIIIYEQTGQTPTLALDFPLLTLARSALGKYTRRF